jgi:hypothetical protein
MNRLFAFATVSLLATASFAFACSDDTAAVGAQGNPQQSAGTGGSGGAAGNGGTAGSSSGAAGSVAQTCDTLGGTCTGVGSCSKGQGFLPLADAGSLACVGGEDAVCCLPSCGGAVEDFVCCSADGTASFRPSCDGQALVCLSGTSREACGGQGGGGGSGGAGGAGGTGGTGGTAGASGAGAGGSTLGKACTPNKAGECGANEYCDLTGTACGTNGKDGVCVGESLADCPIGCAPPEFQECGCDGQRYCSECVMRNQGITPAPDDSFCQGGAGAAGASGSAGAGGSGSAGAPSGATCGGLAGTTCSNPNEYCDFGDGNFCGGDDGDGTCQLKPTECGAGCPAPEFQICACDGSKYCNSCEIHKKGLSVADASFCK